MRALLRFALVGFALPAVAAAGDPGHAGRFAVGVTTLTVVDASRGRTLETEVWYPAAQAGRDVPVLRRRFPLVLLAHGYCGFRTNYEYLTTHLASWGFLVAAPALFERHLAHRRPFARFLTARDAERQGTDVVLTARPR